MEFLINLFNVFLYKPLFNLLILFYQYLPGKDFGVAIIFLTLFIKFLLYPLGAKAIKIQKKVQDLQPIIKEIQKKYKNDKQKQATETLGVYKKENINPFAGLFISLAQIPILIALFQVFRGGLESEKLNEVYGFLSVPEVINFTFLGILDLGEPSPFLALFAGFCQFLQAKTMAPFVKNQKNKNQTKDFSEVMGKQMLYFFPIFTVFILWKFPAAIALYWIVTALFSTFQQQLIFKKEK